MAAKKQAPFRNTFTTSAKGQKESRLTAEKDLSERLAAKNILNPDEVAGEYDMSRALMTTLGGQVRPITIEDLKTFSAYARTLGKKFAGGITAKQVIDLSLSDRRRRSHEQIRTAMPTTYRGGKVQFQTNSGPNSQVQRHYVTVDFMMYDAVAASPLPSIKIANELLKGKIKIDCTCEDHRYVFRYISTIGKFNANRPETGMPKLRNPKLLGIACKHTLRVMALITQSPTFKNYAARMIDVGRRTLSGKRQVVKVKDMEEFAKKLKKESWRQRSIRTSEEKRAARLKIPITKLHEHAKQRAREKEAAKVKRSAATAMRSLEMNARKLLSLNVINQSQFDAMMKAAKS